MNIQTVFASGGTIFLYMVEDLLHVYLLILLMRVTFAWFLNIDWYKQPFYSIQMLADPYLKLFRGTDVTSLQTNDMISFVCLDGTVWFQLNSQDNSA